jgi:hypothetical protein
MNNPNQTHLESARLQKEIEQYIGRTGNQILFEFDESEKETILDLITVNAVHRQSFLFQTVKGYDKIDALKKMLDYVKNYKDRESSYTIQWCIKENNELHTSYFRAKNIISALEKLYYGRDANSLIVFSVVLNPIS